MPRVNPRSGLRPYEAVTPKRWTHMPVALYTTGLGSGVAGGRRLRPLRRTMTVRSDRHWLSGAAPARIRTDLSPRRALGRRAPGTSLRDARRAHDDCAKRRLDGATCHTVSILNFDRDRVGTDEAINGTATPVALAGKEPVSDRHFTASKVSRANERRIEPPRPSLTVGDLPRVSATKEHLRLGRERVIFVVVAPCPLDVQDRSVPRSNPSSNRN